MTSKQAIIGISAIVLVSLGVFSTDLFDSKKKFVYYRVDGIKFKEIVKNSGFTFLELKPDKGFLGLGKVKLKPNAGNDIDTDDLLKEEKREASLEDTDFKKYNDNYVFNLEGKQQLDDLVEIVDNNPDVYFIFEPVNGSTLSDPNVGGLLCYKILPYTGDGTLIRTDSSQNITAGKQYPARALEFIPRPPGSDY